MHQNDVALSTGRVRYWEGGPKTAPAILLLHSAYGDAPFSWSPIWEALAARYRLIAPDMPGFGASPAPDDVSLEVVAGVLHELLGRLGVARATVVGNSFGVAAAAALAGLHPEAVERLIFVNGVMLPPASRLIKQAVTIPALDRMISQMFYRSTFSHKALRGSFPHASPEEFAAICEQIDRCGPRNFATVKACALNSGPAKRPIGAPVTLLWGADDRLTPLAMARNLARTIPGAELVPIAKAGHLPQCDQPQAFVEQLVRRMPA